MRQHGGRIVHKSMRGKVVDMEALRNRNANSIAVGNSNMNARGDVLNSTGNVVVRREQIVQRYYEKNPQGVKNASLKQSTPETFETPQQAVDRLAKQINKDEHVTSDRGRTRHMVDKAT